MGHTLPALVQQTPAKVGPLEAAQPSIKSRSVKDEPDEGLLYWSRLRGLTHRTHAGRSRGAQGPRNHCWGTEFSAATAAKGRR